MEQAATPDGLRSVLRMPAERPPLDMWVLDAHELDGYTRTLVEYTVDGGERVQAFLLVPHQRDNLIPGILAIHQDGARRPYDVGKSEPAGLTGDTDLFYGLELCRRGYAVICPDRFGFESRGLAHSPFKETFDDFRIFTRDGVELTEDLYLGCVGNRLLFEGKTPLGQTLTELQQALDCLCAQPEVDGTRIGAIGHSAGGIYAALLMYLDLRVGAGCASCGTFLYRWWWGSDALRPINGFGGGIPGLRQWGDIDDVLAGLALRPFLETRGDAFPTEQTAALIAKARARYAQLGVPKRYQYVTYDGGHTFRQDMRERSYAWFDLWLRRLS